MKRLINNLNISIPLLLSLLLVGFNINGETAPQLVNYQGSLLDGNGKPLPDGAYKMYFSIYDAKSAGNKLWGPQVFDNVVVINGSFNVILGTTDSNGNALTEGFRKENTFLGIKVGSEPEIVPRQQILSAPYAINAINAEVLGRGAVKINSNRITADREVVAPKFTGDGSKIINLNATKITTGKISVPQLALKDKLTMSAGASSHNRVIPLPRYADGTIASQSDCVWTVSPKQFWTATTGWPSPHKYYADKNRKITALALKADGAQYGTDVNYLIVCAR
ncbi:MAG: hypothetical protein AB2604_01490 [Candidatus Thiodiazotropha taylori]